MAQSVITVNTSTLKSDINTIDDHLKAIRTDVKKMSSVMAALDGMWEGNAKKAFAAAVNSDIEKLESLLKVIESFTSVTDDSRAEYEKCENAVIEAVNAIQV